VTLCLAVSAFVVAAATAVRSTWSPCGLSMLSTITPFGERAKGHSYRATASWFVVGGTVGGATLGGVAALLAAVVRGWGRSPATLGLCALAATLIAVVSDTGAAGVRLPIHRRQVNERWLDRYRPWVYGAGFGWQIGTGLATYITTAAVYLMVVLAALTGDPLVALGVGVLFGLLRGLAVLLTRRLRDPAELLAFHRRFASAGPRAGRATVVVECCVAAALTAAVHSPVALGVTALAVAAVGVMAVRRKDALTVQRRSV
jgi:MFS family permease